ncbi:DNA translocase FtsK [Psychromonas antarctica]|uniref:DNA translocase FtsK n=1 Tax=Psychromonas antarctica TaxID=67573 RepID=UPI001EE9264C|nr:DNA translocase FtsK 4TM domain-containing protein [Psychromonas antarctica]MCG6201670.1 DNA translocase FtsK 4TM domain-containing protein [Psychromonas antarctica]
MINHLSGVQKLFEVGIIITFFIAVFISISLVTFSPIDPSWSQQQWVANIENAGGRGGAWIADILFYTFGLIAYVVPVVITVLGWAFFWKPQFRLDIDFLNLGLRIIGFIFTIFSTSALASLNFNDFHYYPSGGFVGDVISQSMLGFFSLLAVNLILLTLLLSGTTLLLGFSWLRLIDGLGASTINLFIRLSCLPMQIKDWNELRQRNKALRRNEQAAQLQMKKTSKPISTPKKVRSSAADREDVLDEIGIFNIDHLDIDEQYNDAPFQSEENTSDIEGATCETGVQQPPLNGKSNVQAAEPKIDFSHLPDYAKPVITRKVEANLAPFPSVDLLDKPNKKHNPISQEDLDTAARLVEAKLLEFKIKADVVNVLPGPVITRFELALAPGMKVSTVSSLEKDLARALSAMSVRVVDQIPGKAVIALELPNKFRETVYSSEVLGCETFKQAKSPLSIVLGVDISGEPVVVDLGKMPHLLVAGTTGSGKSVGVNCMLVSLLYKSSPEDVRMILIDPKMLELSVYEGIPHLLTEVVTDMKEAASALRWCVGEMERRYKLLSEIGVRTLAGYNSKVKEAKEAGTPLTDPLWKEGDSMDASAPELQKLPNIVVVVDEFADMMMIVGKKCEELITRIAQKARAAGIHLILATQRPSVDVITGLIKANIPTRIAFQVSSKIDSRTILGQQGAETLLGNGDMLYMPPGVGVPIRVHGAFVADHEVHKVVTDWKKRGAPNYVQDILEGDLSLDMLLPGEGGDGDDEIDELFDEVVAFITETRKVSISSIQRKFRIGYNRSARLVDQLQAQGVITSPSGANSSRDVLAPPPVKD